MWVIRNWIILELFLFEFISKIWATIWATIWELLFRKLDLKLRTILNFRIKLQRLVFDINKIWSTYKWWCFEKLLFFCEFICPNKVPRTVCMWCDLYFLRFVLKFAFFSNPLHNLCNRIKKKVLISNILDESMMISL